MFIFNFQFFGGIPVNNLKKEINKFRPSLKTINFSVISKQSDNKENTERQTERLTRTKAIPPPKVEDT